MAIKMISFVTALLITVNLFGNDIHDRKLYIKIRPFYCYSVDLREIQNDQLKIALDVSLIAESEVIFCLPKVVPGIYGEMNFGLNVSNLQAFDFQDNPLKIEKLDQNRWKIIGEGLKKVLYTVDDNWEEFNDFKEGSYLSAGSTFKENQLFIMNHGAIFGYLEGFEKRSIQLEIKKPVALYGASSLERMRSTDSVDYFIAKNYHCLVDNPILYSIPDTTKFNVGITKVTVAMYSATGKKLSKEIAAYIKPLLENQKAYLGGKLPVEEYTFLLYHNENPDKNSALGDGLEHSNSTVILMYMPFDINMILMNVYGIASHEFLHTLLPLGLHSEEIEYFDFNQPKFSRHIWLYEGTTEYFTLHMPVCQKVETKDEFLTKVQRKIDESKKFSHERSLTDLSINAAENQQDYFDFYLKGALLNLCLDIQLRELSKGKYGVRDLVYDLMQVYGKEKPFKDEMLFDEIASISKQPSIRQFFKLYVEGTEPLPLKVYLNKVGIDYDPVTNNISWQKSPSKAQLKLRNSWIGQ